MDATVNKPRRIIWLNVLTVVSAAILIGAEVLGAAFAAGSLPSTYSASAETVCASRGPPCALTSVTWRWWASSRSSRT